MKNYFPEIEFIECSNLLFNHSISNKERLSIEYWQNTLNPLRDVLSFPIKLTDFIRLHRGERSNSQHYVNESWSVKGAVDLRPSNQNDKDKFISLALMLMASPRIKRVCWYEPSNRFYYGGFHIDCKGSDKVFFINQGESINWEQCNQAQLIESIINTK